MATTKAPRKRKEKIKRPDLKIGIKDFGPIAEGEIELKPLTVFIGPNNSGKSYVAMLLYSIFNSYMSDYVKSLTERNLINRIVKKLENDKNLKHILNELDTEISNLKIGNELKIPDEILNLIANEELQEVYQEKLGEMLKRTYACKLSDLTTFEKENFLLNIGSSFCNIQLVSQKEGLIIKNFSQQYSDIDTRIRIDGESNYIELTADKTPLMRWMRSSKENSIPTEAINQISRIIQFKVLQNLVNCNYLLASRTGILQLYKGFTANVIKRLPLLDINNQQEIPKLSGITSDIISNMLEISLKEKLPYHQFAEELSMELFKGDIILVSDDKNLIPEIRYRFKGVDLPLHRVSTSVSEIVPLILYLKYIINPGSVLIIEEPEAHLHPGNIRILAKYLVRLVNKGVNVLITTHSEYLLEQLDNFVMLTNIDPEERVERYGYEKDDFIKHTDFAVYEFHYDQNTGTSKIEKARLTKKDGVSQDEFVKVFEELYEETGKLRRDLSDE